MGNNMDQLSLFVIGDEGNTFRDICAAIGCDHTMPAWPDQFGQSIRAYLLNNNIEKIRTLSLFFRSRWIRYWI